MITPRALRDGLLNGTWTQSGPHLPTAPPEWGEFRRNRMHVAITAAKLFLINRQTYEEVGIMLREKKSVGAVSGGKIKPQRIGQYIAKGTQFFLERGAFRELKSPAKIPIPTVGNSAVKAARKR